MKRRDFIKVVGATGVAMFVPSSLKLSSLYKSANAAVNYAGAEVVRPSVMPQVINMYLNGGPSELAGNLTNIATIADNSSGSYVSAFGDGILENASGGGQITTDGFWADAGGTEMQFMLDQGHMSVYRTLFKVKNATRSHRESVLMGNKGSLDVDTGAGIGTRIAAMMNTNSATYEGATLANGSVIGLLEDMTFPFVYFDADRGSFALDQDVPIPLLLQGVALDQNLDNPYSRTSSNDTLLEELRNKVLTEADLARFSGVAKSMDVRQGLADKITGLAASTSQPLPTVSGAEATANGGATLSYINSNIEAAITLAVENPESLYITVGGGLGGWDDHNDVAARYLGRMQNLMRDLQTAMLHIKYSGTQTPGVTSTPGGMVRTTDNIVINIFGDFGRLVNLNNGGGWDHGNNQNLYTFGGAAVRPAGNALGKVVGTTVWAGTKGQNNQVTVPAPGSYTFEPMSVAASIYGYFGAQNPSVLTASTGPAQDPMNNPDGDPPIDESIVP